MSRGSVNCPTDERSGETKTTAPSSLFCLLHSLHSAVLYYGAPANFQCNKLAERGSEGAGAKNASSAVRPSVRLDFAAVSGCRGRRCSLRLLRLLIVPRVNYSSGSSRSLARSLDGQKRIIIIIMNNAVPARSLTRPMIGSLPEEGGSVERPRCVGATIDWCIRYPSTDVSP